MAYQPLCNSKLILPNQVILTILIKIQQLPECHLQAHILIQSVHWRLDNEIIFYSSKKNPSKSGTMEDLDPNSLLKFHPTYQLPSPPDWQCNHYFENNFPELADPNNDKSETQIEYIMETNDKRTTFESALNDLDLEDLDTTQIFGSEEQNHITNGLDSKDYVLSEHPEIQLKGTIQKHLKHEMKKETWKGPESPTISHNSNVAAVKDIKKQYKDRKLYACDLCDFKPTKYSTNYIRHRQSVHDKIRWPCDFCNKTYATSNKLNQHSKKEHQKAQLKQIVQTEGSQPPTMSDNSKAKIPNIKNKGNKLYNCDLCDFKPTRYSTDYIRHKESVHEKIRWKCNFCDKTFSRSVNLDKHTKKEHIKLKKKKKKEKKRKETTVLVQT